MINQPSYLLAIETVGSMCGIALFDLAQKRTQLEYLIHAPHMHDAMLAELIRRGMLDLGITAHDIHAIAVSEGPGSFTGIRIGMSFAKGWCADGLTHLLSVPTFQAIAHSALPTLNETMHNHLCIIMKSHAKKCFVQVFDTKSGAAVSDIQCIEESDALQILTPTMAYISDLDFNHDARRLEHITASHPTFIAELGYEMLLAGNQHSPLMADSNYHADFVPIISKHKQ